MTYKFWTFGLCPLQSIIASALILEQNSAVRATTVQKGGHLKLEKWSRFGNAWKKLRCHSKGQSRILMDKCTHY